MFSNNKNLVALHEGEHRAFYVTWKVLQFSKDGNETLLTYGINKEPYSVTSRFLIGLNLVFSA